MKKGIRLFQSLLSWIGFKDAEMKKTAIESMPGFNPCCRGLGSKTPKTTQESLTHFSVSILVVVDWVQRQLIRPSGALPVTCFNPCCRGLGSKTSSRGHRISYFIFVSILVVVDWVQRRVDARRFPAIHLLFQSLLSWIGFKDCTFPE